MKLSQQLEAILFYRGEPTKIKVLAKMLDKKPEEITEGLELLSKELEGRGIGISFKDDQVMLGTAPEVSDLIEAARKEELSRDIGKAGLETLSIILYKGPIARSEIDYIRGVNSSFIIRNLLIRALVERITNPNDSRAFLYRPTFELLSHLGVNKIEDLPDYEMVQKELESFIAEKDAESTEDDAAVAAADNREI